MATLAEIQANATAKRNAPLDPATIASTATGVNQAAKNTTNAMVGKPPTPPPQTASSWIGNMSGFKTPKAGIPGANPGVTPPGGVSTAPGVASTPGVGTPGITPPPSNTPPVTPPTSTAPDFTSQKNDAYNEFETSAGLTPENQKALDMTRMELSNVGQGETFEQMYNRMRNESGYKDVQNTLLNANAEMKTQQEGLDAAQKEVFNSGDGVMDAGLQQLRARNSRDFITNLNHLSNIASNSQAQLTALNGNIDSLMKFRQMDREQKANDLKNRIDMLQNTVSPTQLALLKTKLDQKLSSIAKEEQAQADIAKAKMQNLLTNGDVNSTDPYIQKQGVLKAINDALAPYAAKGVVLKIPATAHADSIIQLMKSGKSFKDAFYEDFMNPFKDSKNVKDIDAQNSGSDWKPLTTKKYNPSTGGYDDVTVFYRNSGGKIEYSDKFQNPIDMNSTTTGLMSLAGQTDLSTLSDKYPNVAAFKNNNPSGITWEATSQGLKDAWKQAGVQFTQGTPRPENEGGSYVKFASAEDGIKAKMIAMTRGYGNSTVNQYLDKWGTGSNNIKTSFDKNKKINDLNESEWNELVTKQIAWESPNFLKEYEKAKGPAKDSSVVNTILGSGKFTKDQANSIRNAINSGQDAFTVVKNQAKQLMTGANQTKLENYETARDTLNDLGQQLKAFYDAGGDTGLIKGNFEKVINNLGEVTDPALVDIATQIQGNLQVYRNAISGTAYSEQEGRDISSIFPGINKSQELNNAILGARRKLFDNTIDAMYRGSIGKAYDELKGKEEPATQAPPTQAGVQTGQGTLNNTYVSKGGFSYNLNDYQ